MTAKSHETPGTNQAEIHNSVDLYKKEQSWKILRNALNIYSYWSDKPQERREIFLLPLPYPSDIDGIGNALRLWSCIWLAHLLHDAIEACPKKSGSLTPIWKHGDRYSIIKKEFNTWNVLRALMHSFTIK